MLQLVHDTAIEWLGHIIVAGPVFEIPEDIQCLGLRGNGAAKLAETLDCRGFLCIKMQIGDKQYLGHVGKAVASHRTIERD